MFTGKSVHVFSKACFASAILRVVPFVNLSAFIIELLRQLNSFMVVIIDVTGLEKDRAGSRKYRTETVANADENNSARRPTGDDNKS